MIDSVYLTIYFLSYAAGFIALAVDAFAIIKGAPALMKTYLAFLRSSVGQRLSDPLGFSHSSR